MAGQIPQPRSLSSILGDQIDTFLSRFGLRGLKVGGPLLSLLEASAQSDMRNSQDIFNLLDATDIDRATGIALDRKALDEDTERRSVTSSSGTVTISDTSFTKISTNIYSGLSSPSAGVTVINVSDASKFPTSGSGLQLFIGRGTNNFEGPINYTAVTPMPVGPGPYTYYAITLATATQRFHDLNETVILSQGGGRTIGSGTLVQTQQGLVSDSISFRVTSSATIPAGEVSVDGVSVVCQTAGPSGNVAKNTIISFTSPPFNGAAVTNSLPLSNGLAAEDDNSLRERIKALRQSRSRGTVLALITNANGVTAPDENKSVISSSVLSVQGGASTLFIDDGTGYEEINAGVGKETLVDVALGGEQYLKLAGKLPITKAFSTTVLTAPYILASGYTLAVKVGGVLSEHSFIASQFRSIGNATAYEVVGAINGDPTLNFSARAAQNGTQVVVFARADTNEDIEVVVPDTGHDANTFLGFPAGINYTLRLYKNDQLLFKDGHVAVINTVPQALWGQTIVSGVYFKVAVDGTPAMVYKITDADFINNLTGYSSVSSGNSLTAWAKVFNAKVPGLICTVGLGRLQFTSGRGTSSTASIVVSRPVIGDVDTTGVALTSFTGTVDLIQMGMFSSAAGLSSTGRANDYSLNRNTGDIKLTSVLAVGDTVTAATVNTRAYVQSSVITSGTVTITGGGNLFVAVDGAAKIVPTGVTTGTSLDVNSVGGEIRVYTALTSVFTNVQIGDWMVLWDPAFTITGAWRVFIALPTAIAIARDQAHVNQTAAPSLGGLVFVRTTGNIQQIPISAGTNISLAAIATNINSTLTGAVASVYRNQYLRLTTNTFGSNGDISVVAADIQGQSLLMPRGILSTNNSSHLAAVESSNPESGTPNLATDPGSITAIPTFGSRITPSFTTTPRPGDMLQWLTNGIPGSTGLGNLAGQWNPIKQFSGSNIDLRNTMADVIIGDQIVNTSAFAISFEDNLSILIDNLTTVKNYNIPLYRNIKPTSAQTWTATNLQITDTDNSGANPAVAFGTGFDFSDYALYMHARGKSHTVSSGTAPGGYSNNKAILWRSTRMGPEGEKFIMTYNLPWGPDRNLDVTSAIADIVYVNIVLPSGHARTGLNLFNNTQFSLSVVTGSPADTYKYTYWAPACSLTRVSNIVQGTPSVNTYSVGDVIYITSSDANFPSGPKTLLTSSGISFTYYETGINAGPSVQTVSSVPSAPTLSGVVVGDVVNIGTTIDSLGLPTANNNKLPLQNIYLVTAKTATSFSFIDYTGASTAQPGASIGDTSTLTFYPINTTLTTATAIASAVNAGWSSLLSATPVENGGGAPGTGIITKDTTSEYLLGYITNPWSGTYAGGWKLEDGVNWVLSSNLAASPATISLKQTPSSNLAVANVDFDNEAMRLVPITTKGLTGFLNSPAVSGLYAGSTIVSSSRGGKLQISTNTEGSVGAVQITGGTANSVTANVVGGSRKVGNLITMTAVAVLSGQIKGLGTYQWCALQGSNVQPKAVPITSVSSLTTIASAGGTKWTVTFDGGTALWSKLQTLNDISDSWRINRVGDFVCYQLVDVGTANPISGTVTEGAWVTINLIGATSVNTGTFRVLGATTACFWIENPLGVSEYVGIAANDYVEFYPYDAVMPGDTLSIGLNIFGNQNQGNFVVTNTAHLDGGSSGTGSAVVVSGSMASFAGGGVLGSNALFLQVFEAQPIRLIKMIQTIAPRYPLSQGLHSVGFVNSYLGNKITASAGCSIQPIDKLGFPTRAVSGADAYSYAGGLIGEVTKVIYGDLSNPTVYPGVAAAGAQVNISGPLIRRITVGLAIRVKSGNTADISDRVKSAVASAINNVGLGQSIAISDIVAAASGVDGVQAVTVLSPTYSSGNDLIAVQANEKPRILDIDKDILVSIVGV